MYTLIFCLLIAVILPYAAKIPLAYAQAKAGGYNNHYPREQQSQLSGFGARANASHKNSFEALAVFSSAVLTALATQHLSDTMQHLAIVYIISRVVYHVLYLLDWSNLRSLVWGFGYACCISMLVMCLP